MKNIDTRNFLNSHGEMPADDEFGQWLLQHGDDYSREIPFRGPFGALRELDKQLTESWTLLP